MEGFKEEGKVVGIVIDVSLRHEGGQRVIDEVKAALVELILAELESDVDLMYLYHPDLVEVLTRQGDQTSTVNNYESDGWAFNIEHAMKQTLYVLDSCRYVSRKYLILITDRLTNMRPLEKTVFVNRKLMIDAEILIVGLGDRYDREGVSKLASEGGLEHAHLERARDIVNITKEKDGRSDNRGKTDGGQDRVHF